MNKSLWLITLGALIITGCNSPSGVGTEIATNLEGQTVVQPKSTYTATSAANESSVATTCPEIVDKPPTGFEGQIILAGNDYEDSYFFDLGTGTMNLIRKNADEALESFEVSPDRHMLAYAISGDVPRLVISDATGKILRSFPWKSDWNYIVGWLDNSTLIIDLVRFNLDALLLFDVETGSTRTLPFDFPDIFDFAPVLYEWSNYGSAETVFDPTLSLVVYPINDPQGLDVIRLWDVKKNVSIVDIDTNAFFGNTPSWDPSGEKFLTNISSTPASAGSTDVGKNQELFAVSRSGEIVQLTNLGKFYKESIIGQYSWSPDKTRVAFWLQAPYDFPPAFKDNGDNWPWRLAIVDLSDGQTTNYCMVGYEYGYSPSSPIWSPDGKNLLVWHAQSALTAYDDFSTEVYILDMEQGKAYLIAKNLTPVGWMAPSN